MVPIMTVKQKLIDLLESKEAIPSHSGRYKVLLYQDFLSIGLRPTIEYGEKYCDVIYARTVFRKMGYRVIVGAHGVYVNEHVKNF